MSRRIKRSTSSLTLKTRKTLMMKIMKRKRRSCPPMMTLLHPALQIPISQRVVRAHRRVPQAIRFQRDKKEKNSFLLSNHGGVDQLYLQKARGHCSPLRPGSILSEPSLLLVKAHLSGASPPGWSSRLPVDIFLLPLKEAHLPSQHPRTGLSLHCGLFLLLNTGAPEPDSLQPHSERNTEPTALLATSTGNQAPSLERANR